MPAERSVELFVQVNPGEYESVGWVIRVDGEVVGFEARDSIKGKMQIAVELEKAVQYYEES